jgi:hypothetical protein
MTILSPPVFLRTSALASGFVVGDPSAGNCLLRPAGRPLSVIAVSAIVELAGIVEANGNCRISHYAIRIAINE